jgi:hypothetical protein
MLPILAKMILFPAALRAEGKGGKNLLAKAIVIVGWRVQVLSVALRQAVSAHRL